MKRCVPIVISMLCCSYHSISQGYEAERLLLDLEKLSQLKSMLEDVKRGYTILYEGYSKIKSISEGTFELHQFFLDGLLRVSNSVSNYRKVPGIISLQLKIVSEYKSALKAFKKQGQFTPAELGYMEKVYSQLLSESSKDLEALSMILTPGTLRMSDDERLKRIDAVYQEVEEKLGFLRYFNSQTYLLALQRRKVKTEIEAGKKIYGLTY